MSDFQYISGAEPVFVPAVADAPQTCDRWKPTYPDTINRAVSACLLFTAMVVPVLVPAPADAPQTSDRWKPTYPDAIYRPTIPANAHSYVPQNLFPIGPPSTEGNSYIIPAGSYDLWQYLPEVGPLDVPTPQTEPTFQWEGNRPDVVRKAPVPIPIAWTMDRFAAPDVVTAPSLASYQPIYPDRLTQTPASTYRAPAFAIDTQWLRPPDAPELQQFRAVYPDRIFAPHRLATYIWAQPMFAYEVDVPVESWTGWYLDPPVLPIPRQVAITQQIRPALYVPDVTTPAPLESWQGTYPALIWAKPQISRAPTHVWPLVVADVTTAEPILAARAIYPDRIYPLRRLLAGGQPAFFMDARWAAPTPPVVPAMAVAVYPDRIYGRAVATVHPDIWMPAYVLDVTLPAPILSWAPCLPDHVMVAPYQHMYWDLEVAWFLNFPLYLFRAEWAVNSNQLLGMSSQPIRT